MHKYKHRIIPFKQVETKSFDKTIEISALAFALVRDQLSDEREGERLRASRPVAQLRDVAKGKLA